MMHLKQMPMSWKDRSIFYPEFFIKRCSFLNFGTANGPFPVSNPSFRITGGVWQLHLWIALMHGYVYRSCAWIIAGWFPESCAGFMAGLQSLEEFMHRIHSLLQATIWSYAVLPNLLGMRFIKELWRDLAMSRSGWILPLFKRVA